MPPKIITVHGIYDYKGALTMDRLHPYFKAEGFDCVDFDYGPSSALMARFFNDRWAEKLAKVIKPGDIIVTHSNGAVLAQKAINLYMANPSQLVLLNPALDDDARFAPNLEKIHVWYNSWDLVVPWSHYIYPMWGSLGSKGYAGDDPRVINYDTNDNKYWVKAHGHLGLFWPTQMKYFGPLIAKCAK